MKRSEPRTSKTKAIKDFICKHEFVEIIDFDKVADAIEDAIKTHEIEGWYCLLANRFCKSLRETWR